MITNSIKFTPPAGEITITLKLVEFLGDSIRLESEENRGTTFSLTSYFPLRQDTEPIKDHTS